VSQERFRGLSQLARASARDLLRTPMTMVSMLAVFATFLLVYALLQWSIQAQGGGVDMLGPNLGVLLMAGFSAIALVGTTVPIVAMRERGTLRVFATVPLSRLTFLLALLPVRVAIAAAEVAVVLVIVAVREGPHPLALLRLLITASLGLAMLLCVAFLAAARARSAESTQQSMAMVSILLVFASGGLLPEEIVPAPVTALMRVLPTTWFADAVRADAVGFTPFLPVPVLWLGMLLVAACALLVALRRFDWDGRSWASSTSPTPSAPAAHHGGTDAR
jgi:ABC-type multidrug transport system permease subunit